MSTPPQSLRSILGNWRGTEEREALCDNTKVLEGFNVDFVNGELRRRAGRQQLMTPTQVRPVQVLYSSDGTEANLVDYTAVLQDGDISTVGIASIFSTASAALYVGFPFIVGGLRIRLSTTTSSNTTIVVALSTRAGSPTLTQTFSTITATDGTASGGFTFKQNGDISWTTGASLGLPWSIGAETTFLETSLPAGMKVDVVNYYWIRLTSAATMTGAGLAEISGVLTGSDAIPLIAGSAGATEFTSKSGSRVIVSVSDFPGWTTDVAATLTPETKILSYNIQRGDVSPLSLPAASRDGSANGQKVTFATFNGWLIGTTTSGNVWKYDGSTFGLLEAVPGLDYQLGVIGAQGYLPRVPQGFYLDVYRSKLMIAGDPGAPRTFYSSLPDNDLTNIPSGASVGGPNVWPITGVYGLPGKDGDYITGASVVNDRYVIFTNSQTWIFDESSLRLANGDIGCVAPGSLQRIDQTLFFLSDQGVFTHDGSNPQLISGPVSKTLMERVNWKAAITSASSAHYRRKGEYWLWLPINGEWQNQIALVYNYLDNYWRIVGGWYPFDTTARRGSNYHNVTAAFQSKDVRGTQSLLSVDGNGVLWQENVGKDDNGFIYPAYAVMHKLSSYSQFLAQAASDVGENYVKFRDWYINVTMDGSWIECIALEDGERFDQELDRRLSNVATNSEVVIKRALIQNSPSANATQSTIGGSALWPGSPNFAQAKKLKFSFGRNATKMNPVIHWPGGGYLSGSYNQNQVAASGGIYDVQITATPQPGGR